VGGGEALRLLLSTGCSSLRPTDGVITTVAFIGERVAGLSAAASPSLLATLRSIGLLVWKRDMQNNRDLRSNGA
jgi:hypothetical protein